MRLQFLLGGEQIVAIEVDAGTAGGVGLIGETGRFEIVRLIGDIGRHGIDPARNQILRLETVRHLNEPVEADTFLLQIGEQFVGLRLDHHPLADEVVDTLGARRGEILTRHQHQRRMLKHHRQHHDRLAGGTRQ
jgi:hypothetical protein